MDFARRVIAWQRQHGRHDLPWQASRDPYRIWLSEIMLQQTQVATVIGYYARFLQRFPDLAALAAAEQTDVMPYWAGLGYYARARNLHRCARAVVEDWGGRFPANPANIATLPGIGRSTSAAIAAFANNTRAAILDGNVKRVLTRHFGIEGDPAKRDVETRLWTLAQTLLPGAGARDARMPAYTQGLMDLGATVCVRGKPACQRCPLAATCIAKRDGRQHELPAPKTKKAIPTKTTGMLIVEQAGHVLLQRRPATGIWGGLLSLPEFDAARDDPGLACLNLGLDAGASTAATPAAPVALAPFMHTFTHYRLHVQPYWLRLPTVALAEPRADHVWTPCSKLADAALPAPVKKLLVGLYGAAL